MELRQAHKPSPTDHHIVYRCRYHVLFCPKDRRTVLADALAARMNERVRATQAADDYTVIAMDVRPDQIHLLLDVDPRAGINVVVGTIKGVPSHALRTAVPWLTKRLPTRWTRSTFIATVGTITLEVVQQYRANQTGG